MVGMNALFNENDRSPIPKNMAIFHQVLTLFGDIYWEFGVAFSLNFIAFSEATRDNFHPC